MSTTDGIDSSTAAGRMMIGVLGSLAEYERELIKERSALKRGMSLANGTKFGRRKKVPDLSHIATARRMKDDGHIARDIAKYLGVSRATLYGTWPTKPLSPQAGEQKALSRPGGNDEPAFPRAGARYEAAHPRRGGDHTAAHPRRG